MTLQGVGRRAHLSTLCQMSVAKQSLMVVVCLFGLASCSSASDGGEAADPSPIVESLTPTADEPGGLALESGLASLAERDSVPGVAFALVDSQGTISSGGLGFADVENGVEATADTLFHVGSTHKALNALMVATLVDDGSLDWDTPIGDLVLDHDVPDGLTIRHLLTMTGGIPADAEEDLPEGITDRSMLADVVFEATEQAEPLGEPGTVFEYSNLSASAAGYAAVLAEHPEESNVHEGYLTLMVERVLTPLGMDDSYLLATEAAASGYLARSYGLDGDDPVVLVSEDTDADALAPSGSLKSTANDMARFLQMLLGGGTAADGRSIVSPESIDTMWEPVLEDYAMGWEAGSLEGVSFLSHEGSFDGFLSVIVMAPEDDLGLVVLTNSEDAAVDLIAEAPRLLIDAVAAR